MWLRYLTKDVTAEISNMLGVVGDGERKDSLAFALAFFSMPEASRSHKHQQQWQQQQQHHHQ